MNEPTNDLRRVVSDHADDLERCIPTLREHGLGPTADEFAKSVSELRASLCAPHAEPVGYTDPHWLRVKQLGGFSCSYEPGITFTAPLYAAPVSPAPTMTARLVKFEDDFMIEWDSGIPDGEYYLVPRAILSASAAPTTRHELHNMIAAQAGTEFYSPSAAQPGVMQPLSLLRRAEEQLQRWAEKYGEWQPNWLPPAGDVRLAEDIAQYIASASEGME